MKPVKKGAIRSVQRNSIKVVKLALKGNIKPLQRDGIRHFKRISIKSVKRDSMKPANGGSIKNASSESSKTASSGCTDCSVQVMAQMPILRGKFVKKLASLSSETGSGSPATSNLSDSNVSLAQMSTIVYTDMTRPTRARLKEDKSANAGHDHIAGTKAASEVKVSTVIEATSKLDTTAEREAADFAKKLAWHLGRPPIIHCGMIREASMPPMKPPMPPPGSHRTPLYNPAESQFGRMTKTMSLSLTSRIRCLVMLRRSDSTLKDQVGEGDR